MFNIFLYVYGPCVCNKDILLLLLLLHHLLEIVHNGNASRICFIDYSKAFELHDHNFVLIFIKKNQ